MAFFCPIRVRKGKKKKENDLLDGRAPTLDVGRITGSSSLDTLVRVGLEKENILGQREAKMIVLHDFAPCVDDELEVKRGQLVNVLYQENDWVYVIADTNREGFIPHSYCAPVSSQLAELVKHKKLPRLVNGNDSDGRSTAGAGGGHGNGNGNIHKDSLSISSEVHPFFKDPAGKFVVLYTFIARDENDVSVERGELVTVLNKDDPDWYWIIRSDSLEGFVPSSFVCPIDFIGANSGSNSNNNKGNLNNNHHNNHHMNGGGQNKESKESIRNTNAQSSTHHPQTSSSTGAYNSPMGIQPSPITSNTDGSSLSPTSCPPAVTSNGMPSQPSSVQPITTTTNNNNNNINSIYGASIGPESVETNSMNGLSLHPMHLHPQHLNPDSSGSGPGGRYHGTELVMLYDYQAQAPDDLSVRRGDWIYADLTNQTVEGWLWALAPKLKRYGFIPKAYARPPAMTSI